MVFVPEDDNGFAIDEAAASLRGAMVHLHRYLLDEDWAVDDREIEATWLLWNDVWRTGRDGVIAGELPSALPSQCRHEREYWSGEALDDAEKLVEDPRYTVRAWMAVISYLLLDYRFLYQ